MTRSTSAPENGTDHHRRKGNYQLDGDVGAESTTLTAEIQPGALAICVPPAQAVSEPQR
jgi:diacylglycerol kinase family enzyme